MCTAEGSCCPASLCILEASDGSIFERSQASAEVAVADCGNREIPDLLTWKGKDGHNFSPENLLISGVNVRCGIPKATDARRETGVARDGVVQGLHKLIH
jgi:hypothetical protein